MGQTVRSLRLDQPPSVDYPNGSGYSPSRESIRAYKHEALCNLFILRTGHYVDLAHPSRPGIPPLITTTATLNVHTLIPAEDLGTIVQLLSTRMLITDLSWNILTIVNLVEY